VNNNRNTIFKKLADSFHAKAEYEMYLYGMSGSPDSGWYDYINLLIDTALALRKTYQMREIMGK